jgi:hypothetical protein
MIVIIIIMIDNNRVEGEVGGRVIEEPNHLISASYLFPPYVKQFLHVAITTMTNRLHSLSPSLPLSLSLSQNFT